MESSKIAELMQQGISLFKSRKYSESLKKFTEVLALDPENPVAIYDLALLYFQTQKPDSAIQILENKYSLLKKSTLILQATATLVYILIEKKDFDKADSFIEKGLHLAGDHISLLNLRAYILEKRGLIFEAFQVYSKVLELDATSLTALNGASFCLVTMDGDIKEAKDLIERALKSDPGNPAYLDTQAYAFYKEGNLTRAKELYHLALLKAPGHPEIVRHLNDLLQMERVTLERKQRKNIQKKNPEKKA